MLARDCCILCRRSPSRSLKSPLVGRLKREWRVWPWMLNAATPPAAPHQPLSTRLRRIHRIRAHARPHNAVHSPSRLYSYVASTFVVRSSRGTSQTTGGPNFHKRTPILTGKLGPRVPIFPKCGDPGSPFSHHTMSYIYIPIQQCHNANHPEIVSRLIQEALQVKNFPRGACPQTPPPLNVLQRFVQKCSDMQCAHALSGHCL